MHDEGILKLLFDRSEAAIKELKNRFGNGLFGLAMRILGNLQDAEETVNDTYLAIWDAIPPARPDPLTPFIYKVGRNTALKKLRSRTAEKRNSCYDLSLDELRTAHPAFAEDSRIKVRNEGTKLILAWEKDSCRAELDADLQTLDYQIVLN